MAESLLAHPVHVLVSVASTLFLLSLGCRQGEQTSSDESAKTAFRPPPVDEFVCTVGDLDCLFDRISQRVLALKYRYPRLAGMTLSDCKKYPKGKNATCYEIRFDRGCHDVPNPNNAPSQVLKKQSKFLRRCDPETGVSIYIMFHNGHCPVPATAMMVTRVGQYPIIWTAGGMADPIGDEVRRILQEEKEVFEEAECLGLLEY